ncbi:zinc finger and BTB domain-containing protein 40 [Polypterus senegalus]|uniref:zinc finger and BTB domain-containing protein 40 n=1 Tax=Polypterus senegalus TaxID=55291 RepID=UPI001963E7F3|nr:zinc finger and BTB domain-containing protein 40 [Polypterus senegalus]
MELPNYSRQLMQQLHALRKEGQFCDCTILIGNTPYRAHKLVLAASSLLFKSLLESSDTISIDSAVVTSDEFVNLLEMVYTGKLRPGKHNFTKIISIADSLQMFDVAVSCKNIINDLIQKSVSYPVETTVEPHNREVQEQSQSVPQNPAVISFLSNSVAEDSASPQEHIPSDPEAHVQDGASEQAVALVVENATGDQISGQLIERTTEDSSPRSKSHPSPVKLECDLDMLVKRKTEIGKAFCDIEKFVQLVESCKEFSAVEKTIIQDCCQNENEGSHVFSNLLHKVMEEKTIGVDILFVILNLIQKTCPQLSDILQGKVTQSKGFQPDQECLNVEDQHEEDGEEISMKTLAPEATEQSSLNEVGDSEPEEKNLSDFLIKYLDQLIASLTDMSPVIECLNTSTEEFLSKDEKEVVLECCKDVSYEQAISSILNKVNVEDALDKKGLLKLLCMVTNECPGLQEQLKQLKEEWMQQRKAEENSLEALGSDLWWKFHENISEMLTDPHTFFECFQAAEDIPAKEKELMKKALEKDLDDFGKVIPVVVQESRIQTLSLWKILLRIRSQIPALDLLIEEMKKEPEAEKLISAVLCKENKALEVLLKYKELITETLNNLCTQLDSKGEGSESLSNEVIEAIKCLKKEDPKEFLKTLVCKILEERSMSALSFYRIACVLREFYPQLVPVIDELEQCCAVEQPNSAEDESESKECTNEEVSNWRVKSTVNMIVMDDDSSTSVVNEEAERVSSETEKNANVKHEDTSVKANFSCKWCKKNFEFKCRMEVHQKRCRLANLTPAECPECGEVVASAKALQVHNTKFHTDMPKKKKHSSVACDICGKTFAHQSGMLYHKRSDHYDEKPFSCEECGAKFAANSTLKNHKRLHTGERPFLCKHCDMSFTQAAALAYHTKKKHSEGKMYACQYCDAVFAQSIELTRHVRTHTGDKPYVCRECGKGFSQANGLSVHLRTFHNIEDPYDCQKCRMSFPTLEEHKIHIQEVHPREYHPCELCGKIFSAAFLLERHMVIHVGGKPYNCEICNKAYQQLSGLWYHNRTHHPAIFAAQNHRSLKFPSVQCNSCDKSFPSITVLNKHMKTSHTGLKPIKCLYCGDTFLYPVALQQHVSTQHCSQDGTAFACCHCDMLYPTQQALEEHYQSQHVGAAQPETSAHTPEMVIQTGSSEQVIAVEKSQVAASQVYVALADTQGHSPRSEIVAVAMEDLLEGTVTLICSDTQ